MVPTGECGECMDLRLGAENSNIHEHACENIPHLKHRTSQVLQALAFMKYLHNKREASSQLGPLQFHNHRAKPLRVQQQRMKY